MAGALVLEELVPSRRQCLFMSSSVIHSFTHSFVHSPTHSLIQLIHSLSDSIIHSRVGCSLPCVYHALCWVL